MKNIAKTCHSSGADVVFFHHAHCVSGYSLANGKATLWGLGNFLFPEKPDYPFKPWFEAAAWHIKHDLSTGNIQLEIEPFIIDENGLPAKATNESGEKIIRKIEKFSTVINNGKSLEFLRLKHILKSSYLKLALKNYADMARRVGLKSVAESIFSSFRVLFFKKADNAKK